MADEKSEIGRSSYSSNSFDMFPTAPLKGIFIKHQVRDAGFPLVLLGYGESLRYDNNWFKHVNYILFALEMILEGEIEYLSDGRRSLVKQGELFLITQGSNVRYCRSEPTQKTRKLHLIFTGPVAGILMYSLGFRQDSHIRVDHPEKFEEDIRNIGKLLEENSESSLRQSSVLLYKLLLDLSVFAESREQIEKRFLMDLIRSRERQMKLPLNNGEIERIIGKGHTAHNTLYKKNLGVPPQRFHRERRLNFAAELLRTTTMPIKDVAEECGFLNYKYFLVLFKKHFGISPGKFRLEKEQKTSEE